MCSPRSREAGKESMARRPQPCSLLLLAMAALVATVAVADDEKCGSPCGNPCGVPCVYASPPPPDYYPPPSPEYYPPPPPVYSPPPPEYYPPPPPEYYPPPETPTTNCPPPPYGGGGYEPTPGYTPTPGGGGYNPAPSGWPGWSPPHTPTYNSPPGTLYPQDPGFQPNGAHSSRVAAWRAVLFVASLAVAGVLAC